MKLESFFTAFNISASGLSAQRKKLDAIASNIANVNTTRTESGEPYRRKMAVMETMDIPSFERYLRESKLKLRVTRPDHMRLARKARILSNAHAGVEARIEEDPTEYRRVYDPTHPDADENGYVYLPNINVVSEMVDMISASRAYEANLSSIETAKRMAREALDI